MASSFKTTFSDRSLAVFFPLAFLLWQSFLTPQTATQAAEFTLENYFTAYSGSETLRLVGAS